MHAHLLKLVQDLRANYWFIPACMAAFALLLSILMQSLDNQYGAQWLRDFNWLTATRTDGARAVLNVIAGSIIGVAGVTFSITIVAVSYASANFGPRLISNFMRDRGNQVTLGTFIATFVYSLMVLRTVRDASAENANASFDAYVPHLSVLVALILALASIAVLIYFIHHIPETINVGNIAAKIGGQLRENVKELFPDMEKLRPENIEATPKWEERITGLCHKFVVADCPGYVQALDQSRLAELATEHGLLVRVQYRPGDFVTTGNKMLDVWSKGAVSDKLQNDLNACYAIGSHRTAHQNVLFLVDELVEIVGRAMSPGINDPFTAITCLNWLKVALLSFIENDHSDSYPAATDPVQLYPIGFERFVSVIFDQSRQYVSSDRNVSLHVIAILTEAAATLPPGSRQNVLISHMDKLVIANQHAMSADNAEEVRGRYDQALIILRDPDGYEQFRNSQDWFGGRA